jgi:hypothetical protein
LAKRWLRWHRIEISAVAAALNVSPVELKAELDRTCITVSKPLFKAMIHLSGLTSRKVSQELQGLLHSATREN